LTREAGSLSTRSAARWSPNDLPGFALEESPVIWGDEIAYIVRWERSHARATSEKPLASLAGQPVRLRFVLKDTDLYSLRFQ